MKCKQCPEGRRFASGSVMCLPYGMIIREDHEGTREGCVRIEGELAAGGYADNPATKPPENEWDAIDSLPGFLPGA